MLANDWRTMALRFCAIATALFLSVSSVIAQGSPSAPPPDSPSADVTNEVRVIAGAVRELQSQVQDLNAQVRQLRAEAEGARAEARELRNQLDSSKAQLSTQSSGTSYSSSPSAMQASSTASAFQTAPAPSAQDRTLEGRVAKLEDDQQLTDSKVTDQYQTKVESGSKYRLRLSGIVLLNMFENRGNVDNQDFPEIAAPQGPIDSNSSFGGSLRQSQVELQGFGPDVGGAHTSADIKFDFAGGFPETPNGTAIGLVRLRTGTIRVDWTNTSLVAGQDYLFFAPLQPTSLATLAVPPLSYAGDLWGWVPQIRIEHHLNFSETSGLLLEAGILDSLSGDLPFNSYDRYPSWGEQSGQPAYAARIAWSHRVFGQDITLGEGGYYGRQYWGFGRHLDAWAATTDLTLPLGPYFEMTGEFYRGRAVGGLGGGIGQTALLSGSIMDPSTIVQGLDSMGGWAQLKYKMTAKFEVNGALGYDNPFSSELRRFPLNQSYFGTSLSKNLVPFVNFIYRPRSDVMFSIEYRRLTTTEFDVQAYTANHVNVSMGYIF